MATKRISALTAASSAALTDQIPIEDNTNATKRLTLTQVFALTASSGWSWAGTHAFGAAVTMTTTLGVTGAVTLASTLSAGASTLASLSVTGDAGLTGNLAVNTNKFNVTASSGNTAIAGTLNVAGGSTLTGAVAMASTLGVTGAGTFGTANSLVASSYGVATRRDFTNTSGLTASGIFETQPAPASASTAGHYGVMAQVLNASANTGGAFAVGAAAYAASSAAILQTTGLHARTRNSGTGTIVASYGVYAENQMTAAGANTTTTGVFVTAANSGGGTYGTYFGVRVNTPAGLAATGWGVYVDALDNFFGGKAQIGASAQNYVSVGNANLSSRLDLTHTSGSGAAIVGQVSPNPASAATGQFYAVTGYVNNSSANVGSSDLYGASFDARSTTATASLNGVIARGRATGAATSPLVRGLYADAANTGAGTVTQATAVLATSANSGGGAITTYYGFHCNVSGALATNTFGVYIDSARSYFGGHTDHAGGMRALGAAAPSTGGAGAEMQQVGGMAQFVGYNRGAAAYIATSVDGLTVALRPSGTAVLTAAAGLITCTQPLKHASYNLAGLPSAATAGAGSAVYCTDHTGGARHVYSDGANWRDYRTGSIAA